MDVVDALDIRLEEIGKSDIVPVSLKKDGSIGVGAVSLMKQQFINLSNIIRQLYKDCYKYYGRSYRSCTT